METKIMGTNIRAEISKNNKYWIDKHRYYELKHFCLQYDIFRKAYDSVDVYRNKSTYLISLNLKNENKSPIDPAIESLDYWSSRMKIIEAAARLTDPILGKYVFKAVITGVGYTYLKTYMNIPCCKDVYYNYYRKFFWILNKLRK